MGGFERDLHENPLLILPRRSINLSLSAPHPSRCCLHPPAPCSMEMQQLRGKALQETGGAQPSPTKPWPHKFPPQGLQLPGAGALAAGSGTSPREGRAGPRCSPAGPQCSYFGLKILQKGARGGGPNLIPPPAASPPALRPPWEAPQGLRVPSCTGQEVASEPFILEKVQACRYSNTIYKKIKFFTVLKVARGYGDCASNRGTSDRHPPHPL